MSKLPVFNTSLFSEIRDVLTQARTHLQQTVNYTMVQAYWQVGRLIVEHEQLGENRATYGQNLLNQLSKQLTLEFGKGFDASNLRNMRSFYTCFSNCDALRHNLSWTHYRTLIRIENHKAREWYMKEAIDKTGALEH